MRLISRLASIPGVVVAGEYSYHGDKLSFEYEGDLSAERASQASIMCRANTVAVQMQAHILSHVCASGCGLENAHGWAVRGPRYTVCVMANVFCFVDNDSASLNQVMELLRTHTDTDADRLIY